jgi:uncharacterized protein with HEPN domain
MSRDETYLVDILESAKIALDYVSGKSWDEFNKDIQCQDAVVRRIEIIEKPRDGFHRRREINTLKFLGVK